MTLSTTEKHDSKAGFSIIEALVAVFVLSLIGIAVWTFQKDVFSLSRVLSNSLIAQDEARKALKTMSAEIRTASQASTGSYAIAQAATSTFAFYSNIDDDPLKERVRFFLDGTTLKKGVIKASGDPLQYNPANETTDVLVRDIANGVASIFSYYDTGYDGTTEPLADPIDVPAIRLVKITIIIDRDPTVPPGPVTITTQITMRNLKDNL